MRLFNIADVLEVPPSATVLLVGPPGAGKSAFLNRAIEYHLFDMKKPTLIISTKSTPDQARRDLLRRLGSGEVEKTPVRFVDAYSRTVGLHGSGDSSLEASCNEPTSIGIALSKALVGVDKDALIAFESLTPIYLLNDRILIKFVQNTLLRHAGEGRRVIASMDEGIGRVEDLNSLLALVPTAFRIRAEGEDQVLEVLKHPNLRGKLVLGRVEQQTKPLQCRNQLTQDTEILGSHWESHAGKSPGFIRTKLGDLVGIPWIQLVYLGGLTWDTRRFPGLVYDASRDLYNHCLTLGRKQNDDTTSSIHDAGVARELFLASNSDEARERQNWALAEFVADLSDKDHYIVRLRESATSWNLHALGSPICFYDCGVFAGAAQAFDGDNCEWHAYERKCMAQGDPYCELVVTSDVGNEIQAYLGSEQRAESGEVLNSLTETVTKIALGRTEPPSRPTLGSVARLAAFQESTSVPAISDEQFMLAIRLAGANVGKKLGESFLASGMKQTETGKYLAELFAKLKIARFTEADTLKLYENCESFGIRAGKPICYFTTGFLNGFHSVTDGVRLREMKCVGAGAQYCEWEFL